MTTSGGGQLTKESWTDAVKTKCAFDTWIFKVLVRSDQACWTLLVFAQTDRLKVCVFLFFFSAGPWRLVSDWTLTITNQMPPSVSQTLLLRHILHEPFILKINHRQSALLDHWSGLNWWGIMGNKQGGFRSGLTQFLALFIDLDSVVLVLNESWSSIQFFK